jgi:acyl-CoA synthetase (AMP-forming)/AMP-acid ligase II
MNPMVSTRCGLKAPLTTLGLNIEALKRNIVVVEYERRNDEVVFQETKEQNLFMLQESGQPFMNSSIVIVNPDTMAICSAHECGEIWISNIWSATESSESLTIRDLQKRFFRTYDRGFLYPVPNDESIKQKNYGWKGYFENPKMFSLALFVIGSLDKEMVVNGFRLSVMDLEATVQACHPAIQPDGCFIFAHMSSIICIVEVDDETRILNVASRVPYVLLKTHRLMIDSIAFLKPGMLAKSRLGEKQRGKISMAYHLGKLPVLQIIHLRQKPLNL